MEDLHQHPFSQRLSAPYASTGGQDGQVFTETVQRLPPIQPGPPRTPPRPSPEPLTDIEDTPASNFSTALTETDDELVREAEVTPSRSQSTRTSRYLNDSVSPRLSYKVSNETGLATLVEETPPVASRYLRTTWVTTFARFRFDRALGPDRPISNNLFEILEKWHNEHPHGKPPCATTNSAKTLSRTPYKIFDHDGAEHEMSVLRVSVRSGSVDLQQRSRSPITYHILVLHSENGPDELVTPLKRSDGRQWQKKGQLFDFLVAWQGIDGGYEAEVCAVKIHNQDPKKTYFSPKMFDKAPGITFTEKSKGQIKIVVKENHLETPGRPNVREANDKLPKAPLNPGFWCTVTGNDAATTRADATSASWFQSSGPSTSNRNSTSLFADAAEASETGFRSAVDDALKGTSHQQVAAEYRAGEFWFAFVRLLGPDRPFSVRLCAILHQWHCQYPLQKPPCAVSSLLEHARDKWQSCVFFDKNERELESSIFRVIHKSPLTENRTVAYEVAVLHMANGQDELCGIASHATSVTCHELETTFLFAWRGSDKGFETGVCVVGVRTLDRAKVTFKPEWFHSTPGSPTPEENLGNIVAVKQILAAAIEATNLLSGLSGNMQEAVVKMTGSENASDCSCQPLSVTLGVRAKLVSDTSQTVRIFSLAGCDVGDIFREAKKFYQERDAIGEFVLVCKIPGLKVERYVSEGCRDDCNLLCEDLQKLDVSEDVIHEIELRLAGLEVKSCCSWC